MSSRNRGRKKAKLRDISREHPSLTEHNAVIEAMVASAASPIVAVTLGASMVEIELEKALRKRFARNDDILWGELTAERGPVGTLSQKIDVAFALKIINADVRHDLHVIRAVRNAFAHTKKLIDFEHELVASELKSIRTVKFSKTLRKQYPELADDHRFIFISICLQTITRFMKRETRLLLTARKRKGHSPFRLTPLSKLASHYAAKNPGQSLGLLDLPSQDGQSVGPTPLTHPQRRLGILGLQDEPSRKQDK